MEAPQFQTLAIDLIRDIREEMRAMRSELKSDISELKSELKSDIHELRDDINRHNDKLDEVYQSRNTVKIKFGWQWSLISLFIAIVASSITQIFG